MYMNLVDRRGCHGNVRYSVTERAPRAVECVATAVVMVTGWTAG